MKELKLKKNVLYYLSWVICAFAYIMFFLVPLRYFSLSLFSNFVEIIPVSTW